MFRLLQPLPRLNRKQTLAINIDSANGAVSHQEQRLMHTYLVDVGDELPLFWHVDFLIVCSHLTLNGKEQNLQISFFSEPVKDTKYKKSF